MNTPNRRPVIAVDYDGTITKEYTFPDLCGELNPLVVDFLRKAHALGSINILWTCRDGKGLQDAIQTCKDNDVPIDYANENCPYADLTSRKVWADYYIDDRAFNVTPEYLQFILDEIKSIKFKPWVTMDYVKREEKQDV